MKKGGFNVNRMGQERGKASEKTIMFGWSVGKIKDGKESMLS